MATPVQPDRQHQTQFHSRGTAAQHLGISVLAFDAIATKHQVVPRVRIGNASYYTQAQVDRCALWMADDNGSK